MADDIKQEGKNCCFSSGKVFSTIIKVFLGFTFLVLGILAVIKWLPALWTIITGCIGLFLILAGIVTLAVAKE
ncbi:MAG: hypothetical protein C4533_00735 [Candidatus Omnitrophota bacterium]|jgi:uncharacterized membrane protein|nr:MAG: hypothetical protein C4533_00735 [Candidatus Omnitrophota bacterium]